MKVRNELNHNSPRKSVKIYMRWKKYQNQFLSSVEEIINFKLEMINSLVKPV
jgi:hypothetical protein